MSKDPFQKREVIVIDDDEDALEVFKTALTHAGYSVIATLDPLHGLDLVLSQRTPVVVTDIMMPGLDGLKLLKKIKEGFPECLVIFITAYAALNSALFAIKEGAFAYLCKPIIPEELVDSVKNAYIKIDLLEQNKQFFDDLQKDKKYSDAIIENFVDTIVAFDLNGKIKRINRSMENLLGYTESELLGQPLITIFSNEFIEKGFPHLMREHEVKDFPVAFKKKDGTTTLQLFSGRVVKDEIGKPIGFVGSSTNPQ